jgi:hypothetical protein
VSVYFGEQASVASRSPTRIIPTPTAIPPPPPPPPPPPKPSKKTNIGAIVGGSVGGVVLLIIAVGGLWLCLRRKRNQQTQVSSEHPEVTSVPSSMQGYSPDPKHSMGILLPHSPPSTARSPNLSTHQTTDSITHSSPYTTPPPVQPEYSYHHPAHGQPPTTYYPPPDASRIGAVARIHSHEMPAANSQASHEMPTVRSPEAASVVQPRPVRKEVGHGQTNLT